MVVGGVVFAIVFSICAIVMAKLGLDHCIE